MFGEPDRETSRRHLGLEIRRLRGRAGSTQRQVAAAMDWSPSKISRIESGSVAVSTVDLRALLGRFGADSRTVTELVALARESRPSPAHDDYARQEASATAIRQYATTLVPDLFQTDEYTRAVTVDVRLEEGADVDLAVRTRRQRRGLLDRPDPPALFLILDEAVLHRPVGGPGTLTRQVRHLVEIGRRPNLSIQIVPWARGGYSGLLGSFALMDFASDPSRLYLDVQGRPLARDDARETSRFHDRFQQLEHKFATDPEHLAEAVGALTG